MQFTRATNQLLLGAIVFSISFCINLVVNRDFKQAFFSGAIAAPATYAAIAVVNRRRLYQEKGLLNSLQNEIQELEEYKTDLNQFLFDALAEEQAVEASIKALQSELIHLRTKVSEGYNQRKEQNWELHILQNQKQQEEAELYSLQLEKTTIENKLKELIKDFNQIELTKKAEVRKVELNLELLNLEQRKLQAKVTEKQDEKDSIDQDLINFTRQKYQLIEEKQIIQENLNSLKVEHHQIQAQIIAQKKEKEALEEALSHFDEQRRQLLEKLHNLKVQILPSPLPLPPTQVTELPDEWAEFREQILDREFLILKAIAEQDNPSTAIKKIAEENLTMPEVLIDSINERAMDTIGDLIIEPGLSSTPSIREEYLMVVKKIIQT